MNKKLLYQKFLFIWVVSFIVCGIVSMMLVINFKSRLYSSFLEAKRNELKLLIQLTANDLMMGNFRNFRQRMIVAIDSNVIEAYKIVEVTSGYQEIYPVEYFSNAERRFVKIDIPINFQGSNSE